MKVTALKAQSRGRPRVNVFLDGKFAFGLASIEAARLRVGQELSEADAARLRQADGVEQAYERALRFLTVRPRSETEIRQRLRKHGASEAEIDGALERLRRAGLVDDGAFAGYWVDNRQSFRPRSKRALRAELKRKGVPEAELAAALGSVNDGEAAFRLAARRAPRLKGLEPSEFRRKLSDFLARRGFEYQTISEAVARVVTEAHRLEADD